MDYKHKDPLMTKQAPWIARDEEIYAIKRCTAYGIISHIWLPEDDEERWWSPICGRLKAQPTSNLFAKLSVESCKHCQRIAKIKYEKGKWLHDRTEP